MYKPVDLLTQFSGLQGMLWVALGVLVLLGTAEARTYRDPIDLPAQFSAAASQSLLLDIVNRSGRLIAVGERGHILFSDDQGLSWRQAEVPTRSHLNAIAFSDENTGWAVGEDQVLLQTRDGGLSWSLVSDGRDADQKGPLLDIHFNSQSEGFAIGVFNKLLHSRDGGQNWLSWEAHIDNLDEWHLFAIAAGQEGHWYIASEMGLLFRSVDGGESFAPIQTDHGGSFHGILARPGEDGLDRVVLFGVGGVLYTSVDGGEQWKRVNTGTETGLAGATWLADGSALIVGADGLILLLNSELTQVKQHLIENGLPLSAVSLTENNRATLVGLGGVQSLSIQEFLP
ncbi:WD40/YVTN/BNR-like repeat-containing protein [Motiliproteus coralliicola]|nr:YCF48-related protein [Motiliproteus coralliicola]